MMPTFPSPSVKFRTVSFPQYGFKVGISDGACQTTHKAASRGSHPPFLPFASNIGFLGLRRGTLCAWAPPFKRPSPLYPRGPRSDPVFALQVINAYLAPSVPLAISSQFPCLAGYV